MNSCVFAGPADVVTLVEACLDQHLLLAAAGVDQNVGFEVHYQGMAANPENEGGDDFHQQHHFRSRGLSDLPHLGGGSAVAQLRKSHVWIHFFPWLIKPAC